MKHIFDVDIASKYGVNAAIILENLGYWIKENEANERNFHDGDYWTFNSKRAYQDMFPYMTEKQIRTAFQTLIDDGLVKTGVFNEKPCDRTLWYALTEKGKSILPLGQNHLPYRANPFAPEGKPIPNINTYINTDINTNNPPISPHSGERRKQFVPPTIDDVRAYAIEKGIEDDAESFFYYYDSKDWKVGREKMKNWKSAYSGWVLRNKKSKNGNRQQSAKEKMDDFYKMTEEWANG